MCTCSHCVAALSNSSIIKCKSLEREALLKFKQSVKNNVDVESWVGEDCCTWRGVGCDVTGNIIHFQAIGICDKRDYLISVGITNTRRCTNEIDIHGHWYGLDLEADAVVFNKIMSTLLELKHLTHLKLVGVNLFGPISPLIGSMKNLRYLNISNNPLLYGEVPPQLGNLTDLEVLDLSLNYEIIINSLAWASSLSNLQFIDLSSVRLSQTVDLSQLPSVSHLSLSGVPSISYILSNAILNNSTIISSLKYLDISACSLQSPLIPNLENLSSLIFLDLSFNSLNGSVPHWLTKMKSLEALNLRGNLFNHFKGGFSGFLNNRLKYFDLAFNNFEHEILKPDVNISKCTSYELDYLDISNNQISDNFLLKYLSKLFKLSYLDISHNQMRGTLPSFIGQLKLLKHLDLSSNSIEGTVSFIDIGDLSELSYLDLSYTKLSLDLASDWLPPFQLKTLMVRSCKIVNPPNWFHTQASLEELDLSNTKVSGEPTYWISNMSNLHGLNLSHNFLTGSLPQQFPSQNLQYLDMHNNDFSGTIPNWFRFLHHVEYIDLSSNNLSGSIPQFMGPYCLLNTLMLNDNNLEGIIPLSLRNCRNLVILNLSYNNLSGYIPLWTSSDLPNLAVLQLQKNQLGEFNPKGKYDVLGHETHGTIPATLCSFTELEVLDLQKNKVE